MSPAGGPATGPAGGPIRKSPRTRPSAAPFTGWPEIFSPLKESYRLLGVHPGVGPAGVRRSFGRAARGCHPDLAKVSDSQEFIRLRRAFKLVLGYEQGCSREKRPGGEQGPAEGEGGRPGQDQNGDRDPLDICLSLELSSLEAEVGLTTAVRFRRMVPCPDCRDRCPVCSGLGQVLTQLRGPGSGRLARQPCPSCHGTPSPACPTCQGRGRKEEQALTRLLVPAGVEPGDLLLLPGQGHRDRLRSGNLILEMDVRS